MKDAFHAFQVEAKLLRFDVYRLLCAAEKTVQDQGADRVGENRSHCHTVHGSVENHDKEQIQQYVEDAGGCQRNQRDLCLSDASEMAASKLYKRMTGSPAK